ncbi:MAG: hypothetical protein K9N46_08660 [Candidatus Marinimicrobia bacterium]|nr:hypothetical protein [Candidatus Neomarinimicrobiota bacterium]MCF7828878.1 hypothetical protein [Candidatus Neomarinimicrobiota bacterium]MCF7880796.1 hypothetical protein [Candidatus Neomarinimicrobiota bacterium]
MAEINLKAGDIERISKDRDLPFTLGYLEQTLVVHGTFRHLWEQQFFARLEFAKFSGTRILFRVKDSKPSFGVLDSLLKSWLMNKLVQPQAQFLTIAYPIITIDIGAFPQVATMLKYVEIRGIYFESTGIRIEFEVVNSPMAKSSQEPSQ